MRSAPFIVAAMLAAAPAIAADAPAVPPEYVAALLQMYGWGAGMERQLCPPNGCATYRLKELTVSSRGRRIVIELLPVKIVK